MLNVPDPLHQLGVAQELKSALLKLSAALPRTQLDEQQATRQRIHLDARWWGQSRKAGPYLGSVKQALWQDQQLIIVTRTVFGATIEQVVEPLGLVAKAGEWYLVAHTSGGRRVYRISRLVEATCLESGFIRPVDFDLAAFWEAHCRSLESERGMFWTELYLSPWR